MCYSNTEGTKCGCKEKLQSEEITAFRSNEEAEKIYKEQEERMEKEMAKQCTEGCALGVSVDEKNMGAKANDGFTRDDSSTATRLLDKNWSPLIVRKYQMEGWPLFIGIITDCNLNNLDTLIYKLRDEADREGFLDGKIQSVRNFCGYLNDGIVKHYNSIKTGSCEGVMVCWYVDKMWCSAAFGDLMVHEKCVLEFYQIVNTLPHI